MSKYPYWFKEDFMMGSFLNEPAPPKAQHTPSEDPCHCEHRAVQVSEPGLVSHPEYYEQSSNQVLGSQLEDYIEAPWGAQDPPWSPLETRNWHGSTALDWAPLNGLSSLSYSPTLLDSDFQTFSSRSIGDDDASFTPHSRQTPHLPTCTDSTDNDTITCPICETEFNGSYRKGNLARHLKTKHERSARRFECGVRNCEKGFYRMDKLKDHVRQAHKGEVNVGDDGLLIFDHDEVEKPSTYYCTEPGCEREFRLRADLHKHERVHLSSTQRPHKCSECEQSFLFPKDLRRHQTTHAGPFGRLQCPVSSCNFACKRKDGLIRHSRKAHPEKGSQRDI